MSTIHIIGLGPGNPGQLTADARKALRRGRPLYLRTCRHPLAGYLTDRGISFRSFDYLYRSGTSFEQVYRFIARTLIKSASKYGQVYYAVPGHPLVGEAAVEQLLSRAQRRGISIKLFPGLSFIEPVLEALNLDLLNGVTVLDVLRLDRLVEPCPQHLILAQVYCREVASRAKLALLNLYPADFPVTIVKQAGLPGERIWHLPLYLLDRRPWFNHCTALYLPPAGGYRLGELLEIMARLRSERGCPWDRRQTHHSLRPYLIEESYEVVAAIEQQDMASLQEELGDLLLQVVFHSQVARENGDFTIYQVIEGIVNKLIRRHPHVFGKETATSEEKVMKRWQQIKSTEKGGRRPDLEAISFGLPSLLKAFKVQEKASDLGFDWPTVNGALDKLREELLELEDAYRQDHWAKIEEELGDFMFAAVNVSRFFKMNPELVLDKAVRKFIARFEYIQQRVESSKRPFSSYTQEQLDEWWEEAKKYREN
ncbi:MAG TPA: nucleoside triphosphate pyrophosphohydrolase [Firmicutes bacterium]|nr:nucleoside triphosphate pyrophosphohydrolase [Bacillota bacterium]